MINVSLSLAAYNGKGTFANSMILIKTVYFITELMLNKAIYL